MSYDVTLQHVMFLNRINRQSAIERFLVIQKLQTKEEDSEYTLCCWRIGTRSDTMLIINHKTIYSLVAITGCSHTVQCMDFSLLFSRMKMKYVCKTAGYLTDQSRKQPNSKNGSLCKLL